MWVVSERIFGTIVERVDGHTSSDDARPTGGGVVAMREHGERENGERGSTGPKVVV